jgi:acetyl esterase
LERAVLPPLLRLPRSLLVRLAGGERVERDGLLLDEQVQFLLHSAARLGVQPMSAYSVPRAREEMLRSCLALAPARVPMADVSLRAFRGPRGPIRARLYRPRALRGQSAAPALVYLHGGGWVVGGLDDYDAVCRALAEQAGCVVISVDYRLAPEHRFPAAVDDALAAFREVHARSEELGIDPRRLAVGGDSAGGNLSAVLCQQQREVGGPMPRFQLLVYPATDLAGFTRSRQLFGHGYFLEESTIQWFLDHYLADREQALDVRASPLRARDFSALPPALLLVAGFDPLRDEGLAYADALRAAGVTVEVRHDTAMFHGYFCASGGLAIAQDALAHAARAVRLALQSP